MEPIQIGLVEYLAKSVYSTDLTRPHSVDGKFRPLNHYHYSPVDTAPALEQILDQIKNWPPFVEIGLNTVLCSVSLFSRHF
jgi:hypothetical protein